MRASKGKRLLRPLFAMAAVGALLLPAGASPPPPYDGTLFLDPDIITPDDPTSFTGLTDAGSERRRMFDRRVNNWIMVTPFLFIARYSDGADIEVQVNPEFGDVETARAEAERFAVVIGRLPAALRSDVQTVWIHQGDELFGGGNFNLLIHTGQAENYLRSGFLEEALIHEAVHTSLDAAHAAAPGWLEAQAADGAFISTYARDNPDREDLAESFSAYFAYRFRSGRIDPAMAETIASTIAARIDYFDGQQFDLRPAVAP